MCLCMCVWNESTIHVIYMYLSLGAVSTSLYGGGAGGVVSPPLHLMAVQCMYVPGNQHSKDVLTGT